MTNNSLLTTAYTAVLTREDYTIWGVMKVSYICLYSIYSTRLSIAAIDITIHRRYL